MRIQVVALALVTLLPHAALAAEHPSLAQARVLYNSGDYDGAIAAAAISRADPGSADASALVIGRSHIERYRLGADAADLASAREALSVVRTAALAPRDQLDLLVGLGQTLYLAEIYGAAAELFDTALSRASMLPERDRLLLLDWWATSMDREAQQRPPERRARVFEPMIVRMEDELRADPGNASANYWLAVAARGAGDLDRAWQAAIAGWVRASLRRDSADAVRADLDKLVTQALIQERARSRPPRDQPEAIGMLRAEWDAVKAQWK